VNEGISGSRATRRGESLGGRGRYRRSQRSRRKSVELLLPGVLGFRSDSVGDHAAPEPNRVALPYRLVKPAESASRSSASAGSRSVSTSSKDVAALTRSAKLHGVLSAVEMIMHRPVR
jgi:hypothetical protein